MTKPVIHGRDHAPGGADAISSKWHTLTLVPSWVNVGGARPPARYRVMPPQDHVSGVPALELQLAVTGGTAGSQVTSLPYTFDFDASLIGHDETGALHVFTVKADGTVWDGVA